MAVAFDAAANGAFGTAVAPATSLTIPITAAVGAAMAVDVHIGSQGIDVSTYTISVTYNGTTLASVKRQAPSSNTAVSELFTALNVGDGAAHNVVVTVSTGCQIVAGVYTATGVNSFGTAAGSAPGISGNSGTVAIPSSSGDLVYAGGAHGDNITGVGAGGTQRYLNNWLTNTAGSCGVGGQWTGATTSTNVSFTSSVSDHWVIVGVAFSAAGGGGGGTTFNITPSGSISATGALAKATSKPFGGTSSAAGALAKQAGKALAGAVATSGVLVRSVLKALAGSSSTTGAITLTRVILRSFTGSITATGALVKQTAKPFAGSIASSAAIAKQVAKPFAASTAASGALTRLVAKRATGSITSSGAVAFIRVILRSFGGSITPAGALRKQTAKPLAGTVGPSGSLAKLLRRTFTATVSAVGAVVASKIGPITPVPPINVAWRDSPASVDWTEAPTAVAWSETNPTINFQEEG